MGLGGAPSPDRFRTAGGSGMTARGTASRFLQSVLQNGVGRYICHLKRISIVFSKDGPGSRGVREYIEEGLVDFARQNPGIVVYVTQKRCNIPKLVGEYLNGAVREESLSTKTAPEVAQIIHKMTTQSGLDKIRIRKPFHTDNPSIQGQWNPFVNKPSVLNVQDFKKD